MKYKNIITGAIIETTSVIHGGGWQPDEKKKPIPKSTGKKKDENICND